MLPNVGQSDGHLAMEGPDSEPSQTLRQAKANGSRKLYGTCGGRGGCDGDGVCTTGNGDANEASGGTFSRPVNDAAIASVG
ncbi:GD18003 [Drosophila simulans]|uniref:GD18003 n=1 Tax=Drosophila simulans TaxID=7240 RepID=B4QZE7_DROSI|nr:GD18003 [Drosophila simulans]